MMKGPKVSPWGFFHVQWEYGGVKMAMKKTTVDGKVLNERTADMLALWEFNSLTNYYVVQGSYNAGGVAASGGTHDGGGALDISVYGLGDTTQKKWHVKQGRLAGFMAYYRPTLPGVWNEHIHAGALGDPDASSGLQNQFAEYRNGGDALVGGAPDPDPKVHPIRVYPKVTHKKVNMVTVYRQFRVKNPKKRTAVARVQWVLNEKTGSNLVCDGVAGPATREAYKKWERQIDAAKKDGLPNKRNLEHLGRGRFKVSFVGWEKFIKAKQTRDKKSAELREREKPTFPKK